MPNQKPQTTTQSQLPEIQIHFVLVGTTHSGNIGAVARAMKTMGFSSLRLVDPCKYQTQEALVRASGAGDIIHKAVVFDSLSEALSDCSSVYGTSARSRSLEWSTVSSRGAAESIARMQRQDNSASVAVVFGRERSGLTNEELSLCDQRLCIPSVESFSSLNLGSAVQVVAYELKLALKSIDEPPVSEDVASAEDDHQDKVADNRSMENFYAHLEQTLVEIGFLDQNNPRLLMRRLRRYFLRNRPERRELNILRGILTAAQKKSGS